MVREIICKALNGVHHGNDDYDDDDDDDDNVYSVVYNQVIGTIA